MAEAKDSVNMLDAQAQPCLWTREGFGGPVAANLRTAYTPDYVQADGPHAPRRVVLDRLTPQDEGSADALPSVLATSRKGLRVLVSGRREAMPFVVRNAECDEVHHIQTGEVLFQTEFGELTAGPGDLVFIPRAVAYRYRPLNGGMRSLILESPWQLEVNAPFGIIPPGATVRSEIKPDPVGAGATRLLVKTDDEIARFDLPYDPLAVLACVVEHSPVWKINLAQIQTGTFSPVGGPPVQFITSQNSEFCLFNLSARASLRPPVHLNADYDELIVYVRGPGAWGAVTEPGTLTHVPKGIPHQGPNENVPEGYLAWLLECRATLRWNTESIKQTQPMETANYGILGSDQQGFCE